FVAGETATTAAGLQSAAGDGEILLGERTYRLVRAGVEPEFLPPMEVKGKLEAVSAYRLLAGAESAEGVPRRLDAPLIGRERELETLRQEFRRAVEEGRCRLVTLLGEAGVGKSRLVRELASAVRDEATVLQGRACRTGRGSRTGRSHRSCAEWPGVVRLQPLSTEESVRLVRALLHEAGVPEQAVERICAAAGGNPLFCEQMVAMLIDEGRIGREGDRWVARGDLSSLGVPATLHALIAARLDGLEPAERTTLARAAVVGEEFAKNVVRELLPADLGAVESLLAALVRKELVAPVRAGAR